MRILVISEETRKQAIELKKKASHNVVSLSEIKESIATGIPAREPSDYTLRILQGYKVVYTQEEQPNIGICAHLSVSVDSLGKYPNELAIAEICKLFEIKFPGCVQLWTDKQTQSINVLDKVVV